MARVRHTKLLIVALALSCVSLFAGCGGDGTSGESVPETTRNEAAAPTVPEDAQRTTALAGAEEADRLAAGWREDAELYAIASMTPQVDAEGRAPGWLYSYVSPSAGAVAIVPVIGGKAEPSPEQQLPEEQVEEISENVLPPPEELLDSPEAMARADEVREVLQREPEADASAGVDSFSSEDPTWIFATASGDERVEERITATGS